MATTYVTAGLGFLAAILWLDLMFDVQLLRNAQAAPQAQDDGLALVAAYYRHATGGASPMQLLIGVVMLVTLGAMIVQLSNGACPRWVSWASLIGAAGPIALAWAHTLPNAIKLGATPNDASAERNRLARSVLRDHLVALTGIGSTLALQLAYGR